MRQPSSSARRRVPATDQTSSASSTLASMPSHIVVAGQGAASGSPGCMRIRQLRPPNRISRWYAMPAAATGPGSVAYSGRPGPSVTSSIEIRSASRACGSIAEPISSLAMNDAAIEPRSRALRSATVAGGGPPL